MTEIERKFLVNSQEYKKEAFENLEISQGYLNSDPERTVRIRTKGKEAYITIKGKSSANGLSRYEWEKVIPVGEAEELLKLCEPGKIEKIRYYVKAEDLVFEVDEFRGENEGLTIAEIELPTEESNFHKPLWLGKEVTGDARFYNSNLIKNPFKNWKI